jgi:hypothetical protein
MITGLVNQIRIHARGAGLVTNQATLQNLQSSTPHALRKAQDLVVATSKYRKKSGLFSTEKSRLIKVQHSFYDLQRALIEDGFLEQKRDKNGDIWITIEYLSLFSDTFPNWQPEYEVLNQLIPHF